MKRLFLVTLLMGLLVLFVGCATEPEGVVLPYPEEGNQYRMSEVCQYLQNEGYDVHGVVNYTVYSDDIEDLLNIIPPLVRGPIETFLNNGVTIEFEANSLCNPPNN